MQQRITGDSSDSRSFRTDTKRLENPHAVIGLNRMQFGKEVYSFAYENFTSLEISKSEVRGPLYKSKDARDIIKSVDLLSFFVAAYAAIEQHDDFSKLTAKSVADFTREFYNESYLEDLQIEFSSPGLFRVYSKNRKLAIFIAGSIAIFLVSGTAILSGQDVTSVHPSPQHPNDAAYVETMDALMRAVTPQQRNELKALAKDAKSAIGLSTDIRIVP